MTFKRLLILGGTGRAGQALVREALARGHEVTALARDPSVREPLAREQLVVRAGDMRDVSVLEALVAEGHDAVLSTLGIFQKSPGTPLADMTLPMIRLLEEHGPRRIVVMSSLGAGDSRGQGNLVVQYVTRVVLRHVLVDKSEQERHLAESSLDWTVLRPPRLVTQDSARPVRRWQGTDHPRRTRWSVSVKDAADLMLDLMNDPATIGQVWQCAY